MADDDGAKKSDGRVAWVRSRVVSSLKLKDETKLDRLFANEDFAAAIASFLDTSDTNRLLIFDSGKGELAAVRAAGVRQAGAARRRPAGGKCKLSSGARVDRDAPRRRRALFVRTRALHGTSPRRNARFLRPPAPLAALGSHFRAQP